MSRLTAVSKSEEIKVSVSNTLDILVSCKDCREWEELKYLRKELKSYYLFTCTCVVQGRIQAARVEETLSLEPDRV